MNSILGLHTIHGIRQSENSPSQKTSYDTSNERNCIVNDLNHHTATADQRTWTWPNENDVARIWDMGMTNNYYLMEHFQCLVWHCAQMLWLLFIQLYDVAAAASAVIAIHHCLKKRNETLSNYNSTNANRFVRLRQHQQAAQCALNNNGRVCCNVGYSICSYRCLLNCSYLSLSLSPTSAKQSFLSLNGFVLKRQSIPTIYFLAFNFFLRRYEAKEYFLGNDVIESWKNKN